MAIKNKILLFLLIFLHVSNLFAQEGSGTSMNFHVETMTRFIQRLTWNPVDYVLRYEVEIQRMEGRTYQNAATEFTENTFIEVSLAPGEYRYRITPYDLFDRPSQSSDWVSFRILAALNPEIFGFSPESFTLTEEHSEYVLEVYGRNLNSQSIIDLRRPGINPQPIVPQRTQMLQGDRGARLYFTGDQLQEGIYIFYVRNPGGLETSLGDFLIENPRAGASQVVYVAGQPGVPGIAIAPASHNVLDGPFEMYWSAAWMPLLPVYSGNKILFDDSPSFAGASIRFSVISQKENFFLLGLEFSTSFFNSTAVIDDVEISLQAVTIGLNLLTQKKLSNNMSAFTFRFGFGYTMLPGHKEVTSSMSPTDNFYTSMGASYMWPLTNTLFLETGLDHVNKFTDIYSGALRPWLGLGLKR